MSYFLFDWDAEPRSRRRRAEAAPGIITRSYLLARRSPLLELEVSILEENSEKRATKIRQLTV